MFFAYDYGISKDRKSNSIFRNIAWAVSLDGQRVAARSEQQRDESAICAGVHPHISCAGRQRPGTPMHLTVSGYVLLLLSLFL